MSFAYTKRIPDPIDFKMYGFKRCSATEVYQIVRRVRSPTYNQELYNSERFKDIPCPPRKPETVCKKAGIANLEGKPPRPKPVIQSEKELDKVYRRVRTPTLSKMALEGKLVPTYDIPTTPQYGGGKVDYTALEQKKIVRRIQRPTTATRHRTSFINLDEDSKGTQRNPSVEYDIYDYEYVSAKEIQDIVDRVSTPTIASEGGTGPICFKRKDSVGKRTPLQNIPLISGLPRSKNIDEIVNRLYTPPPSYTFTARRPVSAYEKRTLSARKQRSCVLNRPKSASAALIKSYRNSLSTFSSESSLVSHDTSHIGTSVNNGNDKTATRKQKMISFDEKSGSDDSKNRNTFFNQLQSHDEESGPNDSKNSTNFNQSLSHGEESGPNDSKNSNNFNQSLSHDEESGPNDSKNSNSDNQWHSNNEGSSEDIINDNSHSTAKYTESDNLDTTFSETNQDRLNGNSKCDVEFQNSSQYISKTSQVPNNNTPNSQSIPNSSKVHGNDADIVTNQDEIQATNNVSSKIKDSASTEKSANKSDLNEHKVTPNHRQSKSDLNENKMTPRNKYPKSEKFDAPNESKSPEKGMLQEKSTYRKSEFAITIPLVSTTASSSDEDCCF